jgi:hypothetical protein
LFRLLDRGQFPEAGRFRLKPFLAIQVVDGNTQSW